MSEDQESRDKDQEPTHGLLEDIMTIIVTAAISGILIAYFLVMQKTNTMQRQPHPLLDKMMEFYKVESDKDLADRMEISMGSVSRIRGGTQLVSAQMILKIYDQTFLSIEEIRDLIKQTQKQVP